MNLSAQYGIIIQEAHGLHRSPDTFQIHQHMHMINLGTTSSTEIGPVVLEMMIL